MSQDLPSIDRVIELAVSHYLESPDHNGLRVNDVAEEDSVAVRDWIFRLAEDERLVILNESNSINPHINAMDKMFRKPLTREAVDRSSLYHTTIYPAPVTLEAAVPADRNIDRPFSRELDLGMPQLNFVFFKAAVLEKYFHDPRFEWKYDGIRGHIYSKEDGEGNLLVDEQEYAYVKVFGSAFIHDERYTPRICAIVRDLSRLSNFDQMYWQQHRVHGECYPHPDVFDNLILGEWGKYYSCFDAFFDELAIINAMCTAIGWPNLFKNEFRSDRPQDLYILTRPTRRRIDEFYQLADKVLSDNINRKFFTESARPVPSRDNEGKEKGTIVLLDEWLRKNFRFVSGDDSPIDEVKASLANIRKLRSKPSHHIRPDEYKDEYYFEHREASASMYSAVRNIRLMLACHPKTKNVAVPDYLITGEYISPR